MLAMRLQRSIIVMAPQQLRQQQRRHPAGVLHAALLLLCLVLLMRGSVTSAYARPAPSENVNGYISDINRQSEEGTPSQQVPHMHRPALPNSDADEDDLKDCASLPDTISEPCVNNIDSRMLREDYGSPGGNQDSHPAGPLP